jgi:hypothetical protein
MEEFIPKTTKESKWLPRISLCIGLSAFLFQITILYPWHIELSREFEKLSLQVLNFSVS